VDVVAAMDERPRNRALSLKVVGADPFAGIEV
jgi:hypothetical protein